MTRRVLISGSVAFDTIMVFDGHFKDHILPERVHMLNLSFLTFDLKKVYGGTAANIAFNLKALGGEPVVLATVGKDADEYVQHLGGLGIDMSQVKRIDEAFTAQAFITTDLSDNQIIAFHPGAMGSAHQVDAEQAMPAAFGIVAPNGKEAMLAHAAAFKRKAVPFIFDPGQGLPMFDGAELRDLINAADAVAVNDYESKILAEKTGWSESEIAHRVSALLVTRGGEGSTLYEQGSGQNIDAVAISKAVDPTGCGDSYRGGLLFGLSHGMSWLQSARLGSVMGAIKIESQGPQNHRIDRDDIARRFKATYGSAWQWPVA